MSKENLLESEDDLLELGEPKLNVKRSVIIKANGNNKKKQKGGGGERLFFKCYVVVVAIFLWTGYTLTVAYTRQMTPANKLYASSTVVFLAECTKLGVSICFLYIGRRGFKLRTGNELIKKEFLGKPLELLKMSVPSVAYALQNNLDFVALSNLDASVYQVFTQLKIPSTAIFMMFFLGRRFSSRRWVAILMLCAALALIQFDTSIDVHNNSTGEIATSSADADATIEKGKEEEEITIISTTENTSKRSTLIGLIAVFATCVTAGFAGVYFEKMLKDESNTPFWIRNLQMYTCGVISASLGCLIKDSSRICELGFLFGYNIRVFCIIFFLSFGGIYISLIMKHLDNLYKSFASSIAIIMVVLLSLMIFDGYHVSMLFCFGVALVCLAVIMYNTAEY